MYFNFKVIYLIEDSVKWIFYLKFLYVEDIRLIADIWIAMRFVNQLLVFDCILNLFTTTKSVVAIYLRTCQGIVGQVLHCFQEYKRSGINLLILYCIQQLFLHRKPYASLILILTLYFYSQKLVQYEAFDSIKNSSIFLVFC